MNEKLLILYLVRLLGSLWNEIHKIDEALGPDVDRVEIKQYEMSEEAKGFVAAMGLAKPEVDIQEAEPGIAEVLLGLEDFAGHLSSDIDDLRGEE